jgi:hypothetical protein
MIPNRRHNLAKRNNSGGAAMSGGQRYQAQVTAWWAARILLQTPVGATYGLSAISIPRHIYCETGDSTDDLRVEFTCGGQLFAQCKRSLSLSAATEKDWGKTLTQFYLELCKTVSTGTERRFALFYERSNGNLEKLSAALDRHRSLPTGSSLSDATFNTEEKRLVNDLSRLLGMLEAKPELSGLSDRREELLRHIYIIQMRLGNSGSEYPPVVDALRNGLLLSPEDTVKTLNSLHTLADDLLAERGSTDGLQLRGRLKGEGVILQGRVDFRLDFERLDAFTRQQHSMHELQGRSKLRIGLVPLSLKRPVVEAMVKAIEKNSFLVVGAAGNGKTGCLMSLAEILRRERQKVWYWAADSLISSSKQEMATHLGLQHTWGDLFAEIASGEGVFLIIDGLDGARDASAQKAYQQLLSLALQRGVRVAASIRLFDARYAVELKKLFASSGNVLSPDYFHRELSDTNHFFIGELKPEELNQVLQSYPALVLALSKAPKLCGLVWNLFNLDLLCRLLAETEPEMRLSSISTQAELFEEYWEQRVTSHDLGGEMTRALKSLVERMVEQNTLQAAPGDWADDLKRALLGSGLVRYPATPHGRLPEEYLVEFGHHLLFDYAAELLFVRPRRRLLPSELGSQDSWGLFLRQSLVFFHRHAWVRGRLDFWDILLELERREISVLQKFPGYTVAAEETRNRADLQPLIDGCLNNTADRPHWRQILWGVTSVSAVSPLPELLRKASGEWWAEFARDLIQTAEPRLKECGLLILRNISGQIAFLSPECKTFFNQAATAALSYQIDQKTDPSPRDRMVIEWICQTIEANRQEAVALIRRCLSQEELRRSGYVLAYGLANQIEHINRADGQLLIEVYERIFGYLERDETIVPTNDTQIMPMGARKNQEYEMALFVLVRAFPKILAAYPEEATRIVIRTIWSYAVSEAKGLFIYDRRKNRIAASPAVEIIWGGSPCAFLEDGSNSWSPYTHGSGDAKQLLEIWRSYLKELPQMLGAAEKWRIIERVLKEEKAPAAVWQALLESGRETPEFYAPLLWSLLLNPTIHVCGGTQKVAADCIEKFSLVLGYEENRQIEDAIFALRPERFTDLSEDGRRDHVPIIKARLLHRMQEKCRSEKSRVYIAGFDGDLFIPRENSWGITAGAYLPQDAELPRLEGLQQSDDVANPIASELLDLSKPLLQISWEQINQAPFGEAWERVIQIEQKLKEASREIAPPLQSVINRRLLHVYKMAALRPAGFDQEFGNQLFEALCRIFDEFTTEATRQNHQDSAAETHAQQAAQARPDAAEGLTAIAARSSNLALKQAGILRRFTCDTDRRVRSSFGRQMWGLLRLKPDLVWESLEQWITELPESPDSLDVIKDALQNGWFRQLHKNDPARAIALLKGYIAACRQIGDSETLQHCGKWIGAMEWFDNERWAHDWLEEMMGNFPEQSIELSGAGDLAIRAVFPHKEDREYEPTEEERIRAINLASRILLAGGMAIHAYHNEIQNMPVSERPAESPKWAKRTRDIFNFAAVRFHFTAEEQCGFSIRAEEKSSDAISWFRSVEPIIGAVNHLPFPEIAYHLIQGLEQVSKCDIELGLQWIRKVTAAGVPYGLANEPMAAGLTINILEKALAAHHISLRGKGSLFSDFAAILEAYLEIGWDGAWRLNFQIENILR